MVKLAAVRAVKSQEGGDPARQSKKNTRLQQPDAIKSRQRGPMSILSAMPDSLHKQSWPRGKY